MRARKSGGEDDGTFDVTALYAPPENIRDGEIEFPDDEAHHLRDVLRRGEGCVVQVLDGRGGIFQARVERRGGKLAGRILESTQTVPPSTEIFAALAVGRKERMRLAVEKLAELGCSRIIPLLTAHVSFPGDPARLAERLQPVCVSALKQSRQPFLTRVTAPLSFDGLAEYLASEEIIPVFCLKKTQIRTPDSRNRLGEARGYCLVVGPEGGFDGGECGSIIDSGYPCLDLGPFTLRFETAAVAGMVLLRQMLWGDQVLY